MTINQALIWAAKKLSRHTVGIPTVMSGKNRYDYPALDAEILLSHATNRTKEELLIHPETKLSAEQFKKFSKIVQKRGHNEPIAYIIGEKEFFGLKFFVNKNVLIPRPETELLAEEALTRIRNKELGIRNIIDIGTGSGAIAVALAKNLPKTKIIATDISVAALKIAKYNAKTHGVASRIKFIKTNLLPSFLIPNSLFLIIANLPYLPTRVWKNTMPDVKKFEPKEALLGGIDGLKIIKRLLTKIKKQNIHGMVLLEIDPSQKSKLQKFISKLFPQAVLEIKKDLAGLFRLMVIKI